MPYSVAYADELVRAHALLNEAADAVRKDDEEFARYLRNRARDLLSDDYESGDAAWVTGRFKNLNAQIGSYEVYDDDLYGVKTFFAFSLLSTRRQETEALRKAMKGLQALEDSLPYEHHKQVREDIPVGVYDVIADFGAVARRQHGDHPAQRELPRAPLRPHHPAALEHHAQAQTSSRGRTSAGTAAVAARTTDELTSEGNFYRTLWHEVGPLSRR